MTARSLARRGLTTYLDLSRLPLLAVARAVGQGDGSAPLRMALDRVDGQVRVAVGKGVGDADLVIEGQRRLAAVDQRSKAARLAAEAGEVARLADADLSERRRAAERRRAGAAAAAESREEAVERATGERVGQAEEQADERRRAVARRTRARAAAIEDEARAERLEEITAEQDALAREDKAAISAGESRRLRAAASKAKRGRSRA